MLENGVYCEAARVKINKLIRKWEFDGLGKLTACFSRCKNGRSTSIYVVLRDGRVVHSCTCDAQRGCVFAR